MVFRRSGFWMEQSRRCHVETRALWEIITVVTCTPTNIISTSEFFNVRATSFWYVDKLQTTVHAIEVGAIIIFVIIRSVLWKCISNRQLGCLGAREIPKEILVVTKTHIPEGYQKEKRELEMISVHCYGDRDQQERCPQC